MSTPDTQDNLDKPAMMRELAAAVMHTVRDSNLPLSSGLGAISMALIIACRTIGIPREELKAQLCRDVDTLYDNPSTPVQ